jgi:hypothetical protein
MPRLVVNPGSQQAWEIQLKPGINFLGRGASNDFRFEDPSISGAHCQIVVDNNAVTIRDTGSTNGTFVNRAKIQEARLANGQPVRLGSLDMVFYGDEAGPARSTPPPAPILTAAPLPVSAPPRPPIPALKLSDAAPVPVAAALPIAAAVPVAAPAPIAAAVVAPAPALKLSGLAHAPAEPTPAAASETSSTEIISAPPGAALDLGLKFCKFHPKSPARYLCKKCNRTFCEVCVTTLNVGGKTIKNCRACQVECVPLQVHLQAINAPKSFFASVPGAFVYPVRGSGVFIMLIGMLIFVGIRLGTLMMAGGGVRGIGMGFIMSVLLGGYLFTFLQNIIHSTAAGDSEVPDLPGINFLEDVLLPFFRLLGLIVVSFAPAVALLIFTLATASPMAAIGMLPAVLLGCVYFPMAFLAVATLDSVGAVNPLVIIPSILKVPLEYIVTVVILASVLIFTKVGDIVLTLAFPKGMLTQSVGELVAMFAVKFVWGFIGLYLLTVNTRILGLLYLTNKDKLNWLGR